MRRPDTSPERFDAIIALPFGPFGICAADGTVNELVFLEPGTALKPPRNPTAQAAADALHQWIEHPTRPFPLPLQPAGTPYQRRVWAQISAIDPGETRTYKQLAENLGSAPRAVGQACSSNPFPLIVPCHRVVAVDGFGGFANARGGWLLDVKRWLLQHEARR